MDSILQKNKGKCLICGSRQWLECHHVFGAAERDASDEYGLKVYLCHYCHNEPPNGVHHNKAVRIKLQRYAQQRAMEHYGWSIEDFRSIFHKNYL